MLKPSSGILHGVVVWVAETPSWLKCDPGFELDSVSPEKISSQQKTWGSDRSPNCLFSRADRMIHGVCPGGSVVGYFPSGSLPEVVMMQTADPRHLGHVPTVWGLNRPRDWTVV